MRHKKIVIGIFLSVFLVLAAIGIWWYFSYSKSVSGPEWLAMQDTYIDQMESYADEMDDVFALYISGNISQEDFKNHIAVLKGEFSIMLKAYEKAQKDNPIRTGSHTYSSKIGCESVEKCFETIGNILEMASDEKNSSDTSILGYKYLAYQQEIIVSLSDYMAAVEISETEEEE